MSFRDHPFEKRQKEASNVRSKYPDRVPVICERSKQCKDIPQVDKRKYLVPSDLTIGQFIYIIRKRMALDSAKALFLFVNDSVLVPTSANINSIYDQYHDNDGFLYITYSGENTFGMGDCWGKAPTPHNPHSGGCDPRRNAPSMITPHSMEYADISSNQAGDVSFLNPNSICYIPFEK